MGNGPLEFADIVELQVWATDQPYSVSALKEELEAALSEEEAEDAEALARETFEEMAQRAQLLKGAYPFTHDGVTLTPASSTSDSSYLFCLGLTWFEDITLNLRTREFETVVKEAAKKYFRGEGVRIGAPWATPTITTYEDLLNEVTALIPDLGPPIQKQAPSGGDAGWDVVVVSNFSDQSFPRIIALGNCATGRTNWRSKGLEAQPTMFWEFFTKPPQSYNVCLTFFAVPFLMTRDDKVRKVSRDCITFDRIRICEHSPSAGSDVMQWLESKKAAALDLAFV